MAPKDKMARSRALAKASQREMTAQQQQFADHFLRFGNATEAARAAGYSHADTQAIRLMAKPHIRKYLQDANVAKAMSYAPDMIDMLASIASDSEEDAKNRIAAGVAILDRAQIPNGRSAPSINIDNSTKNNNLVVSGADVAKLIADTWMRGRGQIPAEQAPPLQIEDQSEDGEFVEIDPEDEDGDETTQ